jgi:hypothetical protein
MITFLTPVALPIEAATTMGVSVKDGSGSIGKFGTGLKYAIAGVLRLGGTVNIWIEGDRHEFTAKRACIRGRAFQIVHCNDAPCGFTTELGKHWAPWQLFRELASNALDEGGKWVHEDCAPNTATTVIAVSCREVEESERTEQVFLGSRPTLVESTNGATIHEGASHHYYYKGIRAGSFGRMAPVTVDVSSGTLSEDRLLDLSTVQSELAWAFRTATKWDEQLVLSILPQHEPGEFWVDNLPAYAMRSGEIPSSMMAFLAARPKFVEHPSFRALLDAHIRKGGGGRWQEVAATPRHESLIAAGDRLCRSIGADPIPRARIHFTSDLGDKLLAVTCMDTRHVWFSTKLAMLGRDEFLCGYLEEAMHAMTGAHDCTREFQNALLSIIVSSAASANMLEAA